jgi:hypothetical protein
VTQSLKRKFGLQLLVGHNSGLRAQVEHLARMSDYQFALSARYYDESEIPIRTRLERPPARISIAHELYNSEQNNARDHAALATHFSIPKV